MFQPLLFVKYLWVAPILTQPGEVIKTPTIKRSKVKTLTLMKCLTNFIYQKLKLNIFHQQSVDMMVRDREG